MRQNMVFSTKNTKNFLERGTFPVPSTSGEGVYAEGDTPHLTPSATEALQPLPY